MVRPRAQPPHRLAHVPGARRREQLRLPLRAGFRRGRLGRAVWAGAVWPVPVPCRLAGGGVWADAGTPAATSGRARTAAVSLRMRVGSSRCGERPCFRFAAGLYVTAALRRRVHLAFASAAVPIRPIHPRRAQTHLRVSPSEPNLSVDGRDGKRPVADHPERPQGLPRRGEIGPRPSDPASRRSRQKAGLARGAAPLARHDQQDTGTGAADTPRPSCLQGLQPATQPPCAGTPAAARPRSASRAASPRGGGSPRRAARPSRRTWPARTHSGPQNPFPMRLSGLMKTIGYAAKGSPLLSQHFEALHDPRDAHRRALLRPAKSLSRVS